jgi:hypothetical protein
MLRVIKNPHRCRFSSYINRIDRVTNKKELKTSGSGSNNIAPSEIIYKTTLRTPLLDATYTPPILQETAAAAGRTHLIYYTFG